MAQARITDDEILTLTLAVKEAIAARREGVLRYYRENVVVDADGTKFSGTWDEVPRIVALRGPEGGYSDCIAFEDQVTAALASVRRVVRLA